MYQYKKSVRIALPVEEVFKFYININNISQMLPDRIKISVMEGSRQLKKNDHVKLQVKTAGITFIWESVIVDMVSNVSFTDRMIRGPFKSWEHKHLFAENGDGTVMSDIIEYELPLGPVGRIVEKCFVGKMIDNIFIVRHDFDIAKLSKRSQRTSYSDV